jgi:hypothetical protein
MYNNSTKTDGNNFFFKTKGAPNKTINENIINTRKEFLENITSDFSTSEKKFSLSRRTSVASIDSQPDTDSNNSSPSVTSPANNNKPELFYLTVETPRKVETSRVAADGSTQPEQYKKEIGKDITITFENSSTYKYK